MSPNPLKPPLSQHVLTDFIGHELKSPLANLQAQVYLLRRKLTQVEVEKVERHLQAMESQVSSLSFMLTQVLLAQKLFDHRVRVTCSQESLVDLVTLIIEQFRRQWPARDMVWNVQEALPDVSIDSFFMRHVLTELLTNALNYSDSTTPVEISASVHENEVCLTVSDQGIGLTEEERAHLGTVYYRGQRAQERQPHGLGLGCYLVTELVRAHGGRAEWKTENETSGVVASISLPMA